MNLRTLYQKPFILPFLILFTYTCLILDTIKYPGFVGNHFLVDSRVLFAITVVFILLLPLESRFLKLILKINSGFLAVLLLSYLWFSVLETTNYTNYVLSKFHFSLSGLIYVLLFSVTIFAISQMKLPKLYKAGGKNIGTTIITIVLASVFFINAGTSLTSASQSDVYVFLHLNNSYDQKMLYRWGNFYSYMVFVRDNTAPSASIIIPPQISPWLSSGNVELDRYFLYPRNIIQYETETIDNISVLPPDTYIMIYKGEWCGNDNCKTWPLQTINAKEAIYKDSKSADVEEIKNGVTYDPKNTSKSFGLLKI